MIAVLACAVHVAVLVPSIGEQGGVLNTDFGPEAEAIESGELPYRDQELEYPPLSIPVIAGPALVSDSPQGYNDAFEWEMLGFDLAIVLLLALGLGADRRRVLGALTVYSAGILALSGIVLGGSDIDEAPLALGRFDLVPALLVLAAVLAREAGRSATWSALLSIGAGVKAFPLALFPALLRDERNLTRVVVAAGIPIAVCIAIVLGFGDEFASAVSYHTERGLQIESVAATPLEIAGLDDTSVAATYGSGSFNFSGPGADVARGISIAAVFGAYGLVLWAGWRTRASNLKLATALLAVLVVLSPVLSPQFLFWLLPVSAAAYGLGKENVVLIVGFVLTQLMLQFYARVVVDFDPEFVWRLAARNTVLLVYLALVCVPIVRDGLRSRPSGEATAAAAI